MTATDPPAEALPAEVLPAEAHPVDGPGAAAPSAARRRPTLLDAGLAVAAGVHLVAACLPWAATEFVTGPASVSGLRLSWLVGAATALLVVAAGWALLAVAVRARNRLPRYLVSGVAAGAAVLLTLVAELRSLDFGTRPGGVLALLAAVAALALAVRGLATEGGLPGAPGPSVVPPPAEPAPEPGDVGAGPAAVGSEPTVYTPPPPTVLPPGVRYPLLPMGASAADAGSPAADPP